MHRADVLTLLLRWPGSLAGWTGRDHLV